MIIDFHSHFLPCIDDGSKSTEMSLEMLKKMKGQNVDTVVATPHFYADENRIDDFLSNRENAYNSIKNEINNIGINVKLGAEVTYFEGISKADEIKKLTIEDTSILLLELPFDKWNNSIIEEVDYLINKRKFTVLLAHLDRYRNWTDYYEWPESHMEECEEKDPKYGKLYHIVYDDPKAKEKIQLVHKMEEKHYNKFWYMLKKYHKNWWT